LQPVVAGAAEGLHHAVHRLAEEDGDLFVLAPVLVRPRADEEQTTGHALVEAGSAREAGAEEPNALPTSGAEAEKTGAARLPTTAPGGWPRASATCRVMW